MCTTLERHAARPQRALLLRAARVGKPKDWSRNVKAPAGMHEAVDALAGAKMKEALRVLTKGDRRQALTLVDQLVLSSLASKVRLARRAGVITRQTHARASRAVLRVGPEDRAQGVAEEGDAAAAAGGACAQRRALA
jgi:hypothetical protein